MSCFLRISVFCLPDPASSFSPATPTTTIYTLSLHDALPILLAYDGQPVVRAARTARCPLGYAGQIGEHTSELQSHVNLVCRLLLEKKKDKCGSRGPVSEHAADHPRSRRFSDAQRLPSR